MRKLSEIIIQPDLTIDLTKLPIDEEFEYDGRNIAHIIDLVGFSDTLLDYIKSINCTIHLVSGVGMQYAMVSVMRITRNNPVVGELVDKSLIHMTFSDALMALKEGKKVQRKGWNGKGMWLMYVSGHPSNEVGSDEMGDMLKYIDRLPREMELLPWIGMKTADNKFVPWLCSQTDMLAEDWQIVE